MATLGNTFLNLIDMQRAAGNAKEAAMAEILALSNPHLEDAVAVECNDGTRHNHSIRTGLPSVAWGALYKGTPQSKSTYQAVSDTTGFLEGMATVDVRLLKMNPGKESAVRQKEAAGFVEAMNQEMGTGLWYHDTATTPEKFLGLGARYGKLGGSGAGNQLVNAGGVGSDNTSVWFVTWSESATHLLYPKGSKLGLQHEPKGQQRVLDAQGNPYYVEEDYWRWDMGVAVTDWRYNARIVNLDVSDLLAGTVDIFKLMRQAYYKLHGRRLARVGNVIKGQAPTIPLSRTVIYMNRDVLQALDAASTPTGTASATALQIRREEIEGKEVLTYRGLPIRETDSILNTEAVIT